MSARIASWFAAARERFKRSIDGMDPAEYAYVEYLLRVGTDEVYRREHRAFQAERAGAA